MVFIAFEEHDNLGVGYLASVLSDEGYTSEIIDFREPRDYILDEVKKLQPILLGFSVIFQYHLDEFIKIRG